MFYPLPTALAAALLRARSEHAATGVPSIPFVAQPPATPDAGQQHLFGPLPTPVLDWATWEAQLLGHASALQRYLAFSPAELGADPRDATGLYAAMRRYVEHRALLGSTAQGQYSTERYIRDFIAWCDERSITHPQHVSRPVLERYQRWLHHYRKRDGSPLSIASQRCKLVPLRGWFKWLTRSGELPANPAADLDLPRRIRRLPRSVLTAGEVEQVLALADLGTPLGLRDRALMEVLYATGMRRMEVAQLALGDIDAERCVVLIREGKGRKDRLIPLGERALHWVQQYLDRGRPLLAWNLHEATLFLGNEGRPMNPMWLSTVVSQYVERADVSGTPIIPRCGI